MVTNDDTLVRSATERFSFRRNWKLWCCVGGEVRHGDLVSNKLSDKCQISTVKKLTLGTFSDLHQSELNEWLTLRMSVPLSFYGGNLSFIVLFRISNFNVQDI